MEQQTSRISIVTVAYNIEDYVEDTIKSVTQQSGPNLEYVFVDGASTDRTFEIASAYRDKIDVLISEPDEGQYHAIAKGVSLSHGNIMGWLNADDVLMPWTISVVTEIFERFPDVAWITGTPCYLNEAGQLVRVSDGIPVYPRQFIANGWYQRNLAGFLQQESMFWRRELWDRVGGLNTSYRLAADFDLWTKFAAHTDLITVDTPLAAFRERPGVQRSSANAGKYDAEVAAICAHKPQPSWMWKQLATLGITARSAARLLIRRPATVIRYDRRRHVWTKVQRSRSLSRISLSTLIDEWVIDRDVKRGNRP